MFHNAASSTTKAVLSVLGLLSTLAVLSAAAQAQEGPHCVRLMNVAGCVACVERATPGRWSLNQRKTWCAQRISQRRSQAKQPRRPRGTSCGLACNF